MIDDLATIEWRGVTLHRVADLEGYRRQWVELYDYQPVDLCKWESASGVAYVFHENGLWSAAWGSREHMAPTTAYGVPSVARTLPEALAACDAECRKRAAAHLEAAEVLMRGLE